jgi:hypothetical protein
MILLLKRHYQAVCKKEGKKTLQQQLIIAQG